MENNLERKLKELNEAQRSAVFHEDGPLVIIAGAGSGKTTTITSKIAYLLSKNRARADQVLAVTFTNRAANEMKERLQQLIGNKATQMQISTYHSLCVKILRKEIQVFDFPSNFNILDNIDQKQLLSMIYKEFKISSKILSYNSMLKYISNNKMKGNTPRELLASAMKDMDEISANIYKRYMEETKRIKSLDFDDLILYTYKLFNEHPEAVKRWSETYKFILVDEFQDTSRMQYKIIKTLSGNNNITVVGDPDQTIFTWRFADISIIRDFKNDFSNTNVVTLEENYRSTKQILNAANLLIKHNKNSHYDKNLFTNSESTGEISYYYGHSDDAESRWIAKKIQELKRQKNQLKDIAILYRAHYLSQSIEKALIYENINYIVYGGTKFYQRQEIKDALAYLRIIDNGDEIALKRMINIPARGIGAVALEKIINFSKEKGLNIFSTIKKHFNELPLAKAPKTKLAKFINDVNKYKVASKTNKVSLLLDKFLSDVGYLKIWNTTEDQSRLENLAELKRSIMEWEKNQPGKDMLNRYLSDISLYTEKSSSTYAIDYVKLMTVHSAKGLEFKNVFIAGFSEGVFPSARSIEEGGDLAIEEERRLAYVAVTRAMENIYITSSKGYSLDYKSQKKPSRFINELGIDIRDFTSEFIAPSSDDEIYEKNKNFIPGDKVSHVTFGEGVVVDTEQDSGIIEIKFKEPHGLKKVLQHHKSIQRVGE